MDASPSFDEGRTARPSSIAASSPDSPTESFRRAVDDALRSGIAAVDQDGRQVVVNDTFCRMVGWTREELVGCMPPFAYWPKDQVAEISRLLEQVVNGEAPDGGARISMQRRDGSRFPALLYFAPVVEDGRTTGWVANVLDITEQERQERALRESEQMFRDMAEHIEEVFYVFDPIATRMLYVSPSFERVWGRSCRSLYEDPNSFLDAIAPAYLDRQFTALRRQAEGFVTREEYLIHRPNGETAWIWDQSFPERGSDGRVQRVVGLAADITARKLAEERSLRHQKRLGLAMDAAKVGFWEMDLTTGSVTYDDRWRAILGLDRESAPDEYETWSSRIHPEDMERVSLHTAAAVEGRSDSYEVELRMLHCDGSWVWILSRGAIVDRAADGTPTRMIGTHEDVTERRKVDAMLRQSERLESLGNLTGGIAHNFNNLLGVILASLDRAASHPQAHPEILDILKTAIDAADSGAGLTASLLSLARRRPHNAALEDLNGRLRELQPLLSASLTRSIQLQLSLGDGPVWARVDRGQFDSAIVNLVVNARDAMPDGGEIRIETGTVRFDESMPDLLRRGLPPGEYHLVEVADNGGGMNEETLAHAFDPYFTTKSASGGTGLGLPMVYGFCRSVGGTACIDSQKGRGTRVTMLLPCSDEPEAAAEEGSPATTPADDARCASILLVEDNEALRMLACNVLEQAGHRITEACSVDEAIAILGRPDFDLVLSDVMFEGGASGLELLAWLERERPSMHVILTSGIPLREEALHPRVRFVQKPYRVGELLAVVADSVRRAVA